VHDETDRSTVWEVVPPPESVSVTVRTCEPVEADAGTEIGNDFVRVESPPIAKPTVKGSVRSSRLKDAVTSIRLLQAFVTDAVIEAGWPAHSDAGGVSVNEMQSDAALDGRPTTSAATTAAMVNRDCLILILRSSR